MRILYQPSINYNQTVSPCRKKQAVDADNTCFCVSYPFYMPSFTSMKKSQFSGVDRLVVEQFKAPLEKFNNKADFNCWADKKYIEMVQKDYPGREKETQIQRKCIIDEWNTYLTVENKEYSSAEKLLIMNGITKNLKQKDTTIPPVLNKGVLADTIYSLKKDLKLEPRLSFDFEKKYVNNLREYYFEDVNLSDSTTGWIKIPSKQHDSEHFSQNVEKLKALSHKSWCTKSNNAEPYLAKGDFHVYLENGQPKLGIRFNEGKIAEIQGEKNDGRIPLKYFDKFNSYVSENNYNQYEPKAKDEIRAANVKKNQAKALRKKLEQNIANKDYVSIYEAFGILSEKDPDGTLIVMEYKLPKAGNLKLSDIGLSEGELFRNVSKVHGNVDLEDSDLGSLYNLRHIGGNLSLMYSNLEDFGKLETLGGDLTFNEMCDKPERAARVSSLKNIKEIGGDLDIAISNITDLGALQSVKGDVFVKKSGLTSLKNLEYVGGNLYIAGSNVKSLGKLKEVGGDADLQHTPLCDLGVLEKVGRNIDLKGTRIESLDNLKFVGNNLILINSAIKDVGKLEKVMGYFSMNEYLRDRKFDISKYLDGSDF